MGQFYKTSQPTFVNDFMYKPPYQLFKEVIQSKDKQIDDGLKEANALDKYLNFNTLDFDKQEADNQKLKYQSQIEELSNKIKQDPVNFQKYSQDIYKLQKDLTTNYTTGAIGIMRGDYDAEAKFEKDHNKLRETDAARYESGKKAFYEEARQRRFDPNGKGYKERAYDSEQLQKTIDFRKEFVAAVGKMRPDITPINSTSSSGGLIFQVNGTKKILSQEQVQQLMADTIAETPHLQEYLRQSKRIGQEVDLQGLLDYSKNFAYSEVNKKVTNRNDPKDLAYLRESLIRSRPAKQKAEDVGVSGEIEETTTQELFGTQGVGAMRQKGYKVDGNMSINYGLPILVSKGVFTNMAQGKAALERANKYTQNLGNLGNKDIVFVTKEPIYTETKYTDPKTKKTTIGKRLQYAAGQTVVMTAKRAKATGMIMKDDDKAVIKNSANLFHVTDEFSGVTMQFRTPDGGFVTGNLMPQEAFSNGQIKTGTRLIDLTQ